MNQFALSQNFIRYNTDGSATMVKNNLHVLKSAQGIYQSRKLVEEDLVCLVYVNESIHPESGPFIHLI